MSFFRKIKDFFKKLFGKEDTPRIPVTPPPYFPPGLDGIGKFSPPISNVPPEINVKEHPVNLQSNGWPVGANEFSPGFWYVPYDGQNGGPFKTPAEAIDWMNRVDVRNANQDLRDKVDSEAFVSGSLNPDTMELPEKMYLYAANYILYTNKGSQVGNLFYDFGIVGGPRSSVRRIIGEGERGLIDAHYDNYEAYYKSYNGPLKGQVQEILARYGL